MLCFCFALLSSAQPDVSVATGISVLRNFSPRQKFWTLGHTVQAQVHFSSRQSVYAWVEYYLDGRFENNFTATTKVPFTVLPQRNFSAKGQLFYRHFSLGWKHYFKGGSNNEKAVSVYGLAGFGFLFAQAQNTLSPVVDTVLYHVPVVGGEGRIHKLTFDTGLGAERFVGGGLFAFADVRTWLPASSNESKYLHSQRNLPLPVMVSAGLRVAIGPAR